MNSKVQERNTLNLENLNVRLFLVSIDSFQDTGRKPKKLITFM